MSVTISNTAPVVTVSASAASVVVGGTVTLTGTATDVNAGDTLSYNWTSNNGGTLADNTRLSTTWTATDTTLGPVVLTLTVTDSHEATASASVSIAISTTAPVVLITTATQTVAAGATVPLQATVTDPDSGDAHSYRWTSNNGGTFADNTLLNAVWTAPDVSGEVELTLSVTDSRQATGTASVAIVVSNAIPTVSLTADTSVVVIGAVVNLDGTAQDSDGGDALAFRWTSNGGGRFENANALDTSWRAPNQPGVVTLTLTATDNSDVSASASDQVTITIVMPDHPGAAGIGGMGIWGGVIDANDRFIAISYYAEENPSDEEAPVAGAQKWLITITDNNGSVIAGQIAPSLGANIAVFYFPPAATTATVQWGAPLFASITKNPLIFSSTEPMQPLVIPWISDADATGGSQTEARTSLGEWTVLMVEGIELIVRSSERNRQYAAQILSNEADLQFLKLIADNARGDGGHLITLEGIRWLGQGYQQWPQVIADHLSFGPNTPVGYSGDENADTRSQAISERGLQSEFTVSILDLGSTFGLPAIVVGSVAVLGLLAGTLGLFLIVGAGPEHAIPFMGPAAMSVGLVGLISVTVLAVVTIVVFLVAAGILISKYTAT